MSRTIFCTFLQREADGQDFQLYCKQKQVHGTYQSTMQ